MLKLWGALVCQMAINITCHIVKANVCLGGQDIFATVRENSPPGEFVANLSIAKDPGANSIRLCLTGDNADWFYLEAKSIRLNTSFSRVLDREVQGPVLIAALTCYEDDVIQGKLFQSEYRIVVEILNENDNLPAFSELTAQPFDVSELTAVNTVVFTVQARDADNDTIAYVIDASSTDASFFKIDLPNSGKVALAQPLDYETKTRLQFTVYAVEMNTEERYSATANITVNVVDGDDQYPQFQPCTVPSQEETPPVCTSPVYVVNVTEKEQDTILYFSPGPIHAEDGDRGLMTPLVYTILSGADNGRFRIDNETGEVVLTRRVENRLLTPNLRLRIMASQRDDPKKYAVATALVRVLAENRFPPRFNRTAYRGFVTESGSAAALVSTYGDAALLIQAADRDFGDGINPKIHYSLRPKSHSTGLYQITQEGLIIARANQLRAFDKHLLEVLATDQESGEVVNASVSIEVLRKGRPAPLSPFGEGRLYGTMAVGAGVAGGLVGVVVLLLAVVLCLIRQLARAQRRRRRDAGGLAPAAAGKLPNVVNHRGATPLRDELSYHNEAFASCDAASSVLQGKHGVYTRKGSLAPAWTANRDDPAPQDEPPPLPVPDSLPRGATASIMTDGRTANKSVPKTVSFRDEDGATPENGPGLARVRGETTQANAQGDGAARSPREPLLGQSNEMGKAAVGGRRKDQSDGAKQGGEDTPLKRLKEPAGSGDNDSNEEIEVPENPYKL
ncbi:cadherin-related family member 5-like isoform X1 [Anguilla rostrata]|uniref:cadherin-related family member 5-like isoform X1 n=1 Tax=Anguilla rostrata TaxID=7938 RepID=UPI0030CF8A8F